MNRTMVNAAVGMNSLQQKLDMIANNIANMHTIGYKRQDASFQDVLTSVLQQHPHMELAGRHTPPGLTLGGGARLNGLRTDLTQGALVQSDRSLDLAIEGQAMFEVRVPLLDATGNQVTDADGQPVFQTLWTRDGAFQLAVTRDSEEELMLTTSDGHPVLSVDDEYIHIPRHVDFLIDDRGRVTYTNEDGVTESLGQIKLMRVMRPELLTPTGGNLYNVASGVQDPANVMQLVDFADEDSSRGIAVRQYFREQSNVNLADEMTELIMVQRAYQLNARALTNGETMMSLANQLRR